MKICLQLTDDEFLQLATLACGYFARGDHEALINNPFGSLMNKVRERVMYRATPGQILHIDKIIGAIKAAYEVCEVDAMMLQDGMAGLIKEAEKNIDV